MKCGWCFGECNTENSKLVGISEDRRAWLHYRCEPIWNQARTGKLNSEPSQMKKAFEDAEKKLNKKERKELRKERAKK